MSSFIKPTKGYYSIVQFVPDLERAEAINVGIVLLCPELGFLKSRTARGNDRARRLFGNNRQIDLEQLNAFKIAFDERIALEGGRIRSVEDFAQFIDTRANLLLLTPPRSIKVVDPELELVRLFKSLVGGQRSTANRATAIKRELNMALEQLLTERGVSDRVARNVTIDLPLLDRSLTFPFAYSNGQPNVIQTVTFEQGNRENIKRACELAVEARDLNDRPKPCKLNVLASFQENENDSREHVNAVLEKFEIPIYSPAEMEQLVEQIALNAHKPFSGV